MSWGTSWGTNWGGGGAESSEGFFIVGALATGNSTFKVFFSEPPLFVSPLRAGDASNLMRWRLTSESTGEEITILHVASTPDPTVLEFGVFGRWDDALETYRIEAIDSILSVVLDSMLDPKFATFSGMPASSSESELVQQSIDLHNPQTEQNVINGALIVADSGDYQLESGRSLLKKLIIRRITTRRTAFFHLADTDYGLGVQEKATFTPQQVVKLRAEIERQVMREPEVRTAKCSATIRADGALLLHIRCAPVAGAPIGVDVPFGGPGTVAF